MVVLTVTTTDNPHTVYFEHPIPKPSYIWLLSCSLYNSWHNLKENGEITLIEDNKEKSKISFLQGHYSLKRLASELKNSLSKHCVPLETDIFTTFGQMIITNPQLKDIIIDNNLRELLGINYFVFGVKMFNKKLNSPATYFIHCDLVDKKQNLYNGKPSTVLETFDIKGDSYERVFYQRGQHHVLRDVSASEHATNITLSVKDEDDNHFDFNGLPLSYEVEIN